MQVLPLFEEEVLESRMQNESTIVQALVEGLEALNTATVSFQTNPNSTDAALRVLGSSLFSTMGKLLEGAGLTSQLKMEALRQPWEDRFARLPVIYTQISQDIQSYRQTGAYSYLVQTLSQILNDASIYAVPMLPTTSASFFAKYFNALSGVVENMGDTWDRLYQDGPEAALDLFISSVVRAVKRVGHPSLALIATDPSGENATFRVAEAIDTAASNFTNNVLQFKRQQAEASVCWKRSQIQEREVPSVCPPGYRWDGGWFCQDNGQVSANQSSSQADSSVRRKRPMVLSQCDSNGLFWRRKLSLCYKDCPFGMSPTGSGICQTVCGSEYPADDGAALCGTSQAAITDAVQQIVIVTLTSVLTLGAASPFAMIGTLVNSARAFVYPTCPLFLGADSLPRGFDPSTLSTSS